MAFENLSAKQQEIVLRCMKATNAFIDDWEKHTRLGLSPEELQRVIQHWPQIDDSEETGLLAVNNCLNEVCHGFHIDSNEWPRWFDCTREQVDDVYQRWLSLKRMSGGLL
jgi:diaminopimelate decarboxylase